MFYHGFENYMQHAFPEDELRPLTCGPLFRNRENQADAALNDVLGNYSLTLIDTLSTLAIMSSSPDSGKKAWGYFQDGIIDFVRLYGDGSKGPAGQGERQRGFDMDSKVQVFETVIRGLGMGNCFLNAYLLNYRLILVRWTAQHASLRRGRSPDTRIPATREGSCFCQSMGQVIFPEG